jgi:hypothetical protein
LQERSVEHIVVKHNAEVLFGMPYGPGRPSSLPGHALRPEVRAPQRKDAGRYRATDGSMRGDGESRREGSCRRRRRGSWFHPSVVRPLRAGADHFRLLRAIVAVALRWVGLDLRPFLGPMWRLHNSRLAPCGSTMNYMGPAQLMIRPRSRDKSRPIPVTVDVSSAADALQKPLVQCTTLGLGSE